MKYYIDVDDTICRPYTNASNTQEKYERATPIVERIEKVNRLYHDGHTVTYWTARGGDSGLDFEVLTRKQLLEWGCKFHALVMGKPSYDVYIDDKSFNVDTVWPLAVKEELRKKTGTGKVEKGWGHEVIIVNNELYCGKILHFNKGANSACTSISKRRKRGMLHPAHSCFAGLTPETPM